MKEKEREKRMVRKEKGKRKQREERWELVVAVNLSGLG